MSQLSLPFTITVGYLIKKNRQALPYLAEDRGTVYAKQMKALRIFLKTTSISLRQALKVRTITLFRLLKVYNEGVNAILQKYLTKDRFLQL